MKTSWEIPVIPAWFPGILAFPFEFVMYAGSFTEVPEVPGLRYNVEVA
jgi:hypothetical protein